jgi:hypothetical protein
MILKTILEFVQSYKHCTQECAEEFEVVLWWQPDIPHTQEVPTL